MKLTVTKHNDLLVILERTAKAIEKHLVGRPDRVLVAKRRWTPRELVGLLRGHAQKRKDAATMHVAWLKATRDLYAELRKDIIPAMAALRIHTDAMFGPRSSAVDDFGLHVRTPTRPTVATQLAAAQKAAATRKARHTLGKKQRRAIRGVVPPTPQ